MEIALIHNGSLILGPIGFNIRMINSELEDLELLDRVSSSDFQNIPIHFSDGLTHIVPIEKIIPENDLKYHNVGNFSWEIISLNNTPDKLKITYDVINKTLEEVKNLRKNELAPIRKGKEDSIIKLNINNTEIFISTSKEERGVLLGKLLSSNGICNYKFKNTWVRINKNNIQYIIDEVDKFIQNLFDWELKKIQEIDLCTTINEVYNVIIDDSSL